MQVNINNPIIYIGVAALKYLHKPIFLFKDCSETFSVF